ncbi:TPA: cell surface-anchored protein, partial [Streptococcus equi subsp. equi]|nr:cell surface-anchored protein [Streptococcus equi subsp. equi]HEK9780587.1 cell surface-anchored protein [Streptococcus equi subsp. equi]HEL0871324.1 cell surface-anchored protein [Streptococcus equi subsp. equi]HEL0878880.1 cell surface-anchored protein [Streptococcus equi subsp. equi]HEL1030043.1 cell surface-anchored protein [Streptococcus equi subsp. equi]
MNKKSARRRRKNLITKLAMTSALTLGVGAATTLAGQTEVRADNILRLDMTDKEAVEKFANELKNEVHKNYRGSNTWQKLTLILNGYQNLREQIETELKNSEQKVKELNDKVNSETQGKQELQNQLEKEKEELETLKKELEAEKAKGTGETEKLQKEIEAKNAMISDLQKQLEETKQRVQEFEAEVGKLMAEKADLQTKLNEQEQLNAKLQKEIEDLKAQIEKLKHCQDTPKPEPKP